MSTDGINTQGQLAVEPAAPDPFFEVLELLSSRDGANHGKGTPQSLPPPAPQAGSAPEAHQRSLFARHWLIIAVLTVLGGLTAAVVTLARWETTWDASMLVRVGRPGVFADQFTDPAYVQRVLNTVSEISTQDGVKEKTWVLAGLDPATEPNTLTVEVVRESELLRFHVRDHDRQQAATTLYAFVAEGQSAVKSVYGDNLAFGRSGLEAQVSEVAPPIALRTALGAAAGLLLGVGVAALLDRRRR